MCITIANSIAPCYNREKSTYFFWGDTMTLIECFDREPVENIISCLRLNPQKVIFLGDEEIMRPSIRRYRVFLESRGQRTELVMKAVKIDNLNNIMSVLTEIIREEKECIIDLTGGDEQVVMAVGAVLASLDEDTQKRVSVQRYNFLKNAPVDCDGDAAVIRGDDPLLSARELVALHGGVVHPIAEQPPKRYTPSSLDPLWYLVRENPRQWNKLISALNEFQSRSFSEEEIYVPLSGLTSVIDDFERKKAMAQTLLYALEKAGAIDNKSNKDTFHYRYTDPLLKLCVEKAGNVVELKVLLEGRTLKENGKPFFNDCMMGVTIDWDGIIHEGNKRNPDTRNEIDVILMHGATPLFISCKNGSIEDDELYKLHTVATRFGGSHVKKMLVATELPRKGVNPDYAFIQRAKDMDIHLVTNAADLSIQGWRDNLKDAIFK